MATTGTTALGGATHRDALALYARAAVTEIVDAHGCSWV
jgi:hypothetical protein